MSKQNLENNSILTVNSTPFVLEKHYCPSCGKELSDNEYPEINYLCAKCKNDAESTPEFGEKCQ